LPHQQIHQQDASDGVDAPELRYFVFALFFIFGGITSLNDVILPKLKELFTLNYTQAMLVQFCFFTAYLVIGIPGAQLVKKIGYMRGAIAGLLVMMVGCLLFIPASRTATYGLFLFALFVLASGVVIVQVVANPLISLLGKARTVHSRLTFAQAFNSLGTTVFPIVGSALILGGLAGSARPTSAAPSWSLSHRRNAGDRQHLSRPCRRAGGDRRRGVPVPQPAARRARMSRVRRWPASRCSPHPLRLRRAVHLPLRRGRGRDRQPDRQLPDAGHVMGLRASARGPLIALYWGGAMVGRFIGSYFLRIMSPGKILAFVAAARSRSSCCLDQQHRRAVGLQPAGDRADELDHVPDHLQPGLRAAGRARGGRIGDHQHRHLRRRGDPAADRRAGRRQRKPRRRAAASGRLLCGDRGYGIYARRPASA
jgi:FHS family L-fucose permease-like MFS transporter